jgi:hypothetical protein
MRLAGPAPARLLSWPRACPEPGQSYGELVAGDLREMETFEP